MNNETSSYQVLGRRPGEWLSSLPMFFLLVLTLVIGTGEMFHGQMLRLGEQFFGDEKAGVQYFMLRTDPVKPSCDPAMNIDAEVTRLLTEKADPADDISALFANDAPADPDALRRSVEQGQKLCVERFSAYEQAAKHITPGLKAFRAVETSFFSLFHFGTENRSLVLLLIVFFAAVMTTLQRHHISLRPAYTVVEGRVQVGAMLAANLLIVASVWSHYQISLGSGVAIEKPEIFFVWMILFGLLAGINLLQFVRPSGLKPGGNPLSGLLAIPLYTYMALGAGIYFLSQGHTAGLSIYINQMMELSGIFLNLALYIWIGMLLKQMRVVDLFLDVLRPWKMSPEALTYVILLAAAVPTAYTGASGIFVIAAGAIIYHEVRRAGGNSQFALAASAMSGSLGVVLRPCLLVVLIAALNKQVTTAQLYHWGFYVFLLTSTLFFIASQFYRTQKVQMASPAMALPEMLRRMKPLIPYVLAMVVVVLAYQLLLNTKLDEFTAPVIIPVVMLFLMIFDQWQRGREQRAGVQQSEVHEPPVGIEKALRFSTNETIGHIGALITLMALSLAMGGMVERSGIMEYAPSHFASVWTAMTFLMVAKVLLGMIMDPFGAVILVSGTLAPIAYSAGIDPVHFWMMVLVAFELGYLMPPVAINQLLLRQVVGDEEIDRATAEVRHLGFWRRYQRWLLPIIVMTIGLVIVAYLPLLIVGK